MITRREENKGAVFYAAVSAIARFIEAAGAHPQENGAAALGEAEITKARPENNEKVE